MTERTTALTDAAAANLLADTSPYLSCDDCFARLDTYVEQLVHDPQARDAAMEAHVRGCGACADEVESLLELVRSEA